MFVCYGHMIFNVTNFITDTELKFTAICRAKCTNESYTGLFVFAYIITETRLQNTTVECH